MTKKRERRSERTSVPVLVVGWLMGLSRLWRIVIAGFFSLMVVVAVSPVIDEIYLRFFYSERTVIVPSLITMAMGVTMYAVGWWLFIGDAGDNAAQRHILWYLGIGSLALVVALIWFLRLVALGRA